MSTRSPTHRRAASSPQHPTRHPHPSVWPHIMSQPSDAPRPKAAARLIHSVKRTLSPSAVAAKKAHSQYSKKTGMQSTVAESASAVLPQQQQFRESDPQPSRPTVEQIAMGLHVSRTPHLRPYPSSPYAFSQRSSAQRPSNPYEHHHRATPITLPPPPTRSSMKKRSTDVTSSTSSPALSPPFSSASGSTTTVTSAAPSSSHLHGSFAAIKFRVARLLPHARSASTYSQSHPPPMSPRASTCDSIQPKKEVRFQETSEGE